ncbi:FRG domain-containing protein [Uliginosibacterium flavum]|uniref:FRG domain-containing protein n=1 Tax=Uliginosibacterium flavum TaxID=1396831 RepID=A0ABV2TNC0_9RHOO
MTDPTETMPKEIAPGYFEVSVPDWKGFQDYIYEMATLDAYIWRGQRCDSWLLEPTIDRLIKKQSTSDPFFHYQHLERFKLSTRGRRGFSPPAIKDDNDWWALGQHHGLATPLLDWTTSPFVAAFFAFADAGMTDQTDYRAIYALHFPTVETLSNQNRYKENARRNTRLKEIQKNPDGSRTIADLICTGEAEPELVIIRPQSDENQRLVNQGGLFTRLTQKGLLEEWINKNNQETDGDGAVLLKILVPNSERSIALRMLNRMNINPASLFPDLAGSSMHCNLFSEIENY